VNTWKVILATMVIFITGAVTGSLLVRNFGSAPAPKTEAATPQQPRAFVPGGAGAAGVVRVEFLRRAERELNLTINQRDEVDRIIRESQERTKKLMEPIQPQIREEMQQTKDQFMAVLTPEQKARFEELLKQQRQQFQKSREQQGHRPQGTSTGLPSVNGQPVTN